VHYSVWWIADVGVRGSGFWCGRLLIRGQRWWILVWWGADSRVIRGLLCGRLLISGTGLVVLVSWGADFYCKA
jgi:hypothetical protein